MDRQVLRHGLCLVAVGFLLGASAAATHAQSKGPPAASGSPTASSEPDDAAAAAAPPPADAADAGDLPVLAITGVEVLQTSLDPSIDIVYATGIAASNGWGAPQLVPTYTGKSFDDVLDLELVATPPAQSAPAGGYVPVSAVLTLDAGHTFKGVRVRGAENAVSLGRLPGSVQAAVRLFDCADCSGMHFAAAGRSKTGEPGAVREEDLPKSLRVIRPSDGIKGAEQNPNRLTLMLGEDDVILKAFWE